MTIVHECSKPPGVTTVVTDHSVSVGQIVVKLRDRKGHACPLPPAARNATYERVIAGNEDPPCSFELYGARGSEPDELPGSPELLAPLPVRVDSGAPAEIFDPVEETARVIDAEISHIPMAVWPLRSCVCYSIQPSDWGPRDAIIVAVGNEDLVVVERVRHEDAARVVGRTAPQLHRGSVTINRRVPTDSLPTSLRNNLHFAPRDTTVNRALYNQIGP